MVKRTHFMIALTVTTALSAGLAAPAMAGSLTARDIMSSYNLVTPGTATTNSDIEGSLAVGKDFSGTVVFNGDGSGAYLASPSMYVFGSLTNQNPLNINKFPHGGVQTFYYNGTIQTNQTSIAPSTPNSPFVNFNDANSKFAKIPSGVTISDYTTPLNALATKLGGMASVGGSVAYGSHGQNSIDFTLNPVNGVSVFNLTSAQLSGDDVFFKSDPSANDLVVINVTGGGGAFSGKNFNPTTWEDEHVIWNFENFSNVNFQGWGGAVLAGGATVSNTSAMNGFLYAGAFNGHGELHYYPFEATVPGAVPEPSTWAMLFAGFAGVGLIGLRRRRAAVAA